MQLTVAFGDPQRVRRAVRRLVVLVTEVMMTVAEIWRYPVKTMAGEKLQRVRIGPLGLEGDRVVHVEDARGQVITARSHPRFLAHKGTLGPDGEPLVDGRPWKSAAVAADV